MLASVKATAFGADSVVFSLQVTNTTPAPLGSNYRSGQSFDFSVSRGAQEVWRVVGDRMFTQALRTETLAAGRDREHTATWTPAPGRAGSTSVRGMLTARNVQAGETAAFRIE